MSAGVYRPSFWRITPPSQRNAGATFTAPLAAPTSWWQAYRVGSTDPSFVAEFTGQGTTGRFYDGSTTTTTPATYIGGTVTIDATSGLHNASGGLTAIGALKTALIATNRTVVMVLTGGVNGEFSGALSFGSDSPLYHNNVDNSLRSYFNSTATSLDTVGYIPNWAGRVFLATAMGSSGRKVTTGGSGVVFSDTHVFTTPTNVQLMDYLDPAHEYYGGSGFGGRLEKIIVYPTYMSDADLMAAAAPRTAFDGGYGVSFPKAAYSRPRDPSNLLQFPKTQAWTFYTAGIISAIPHTANASTDFVFFTTANKGSSTSVPYGGFEFFADSSTGQLWVRLMAAYYGTNVDYMGVIANSTAVIDGAYHTYAVTYDGSGNRSGIKIYLDGVSQTLTNETGSAASLTGNTNTNSSDFIIGNQLQTGTDPDWSQQYYMPGTMDYAMLDKAAASAGTIGGVTPSSPTPPAAGINTAFRYMFNEGSGTVVADDAGNFTLDLSSGALWVNGSNNIPGAAVSASVAQTLGALVTAATDTVLVQASIAQTLGVLGQAATDTVLDQAVVAQTLSALAQAATATAPVAAVTSETLGALGQTTTATTPVAITVAQNLGALTQAAAATHPDTVAAAQTLGAIVQAATGGVVDAAATAQVLGALAQAATATAPVALTAAQTLGALGQTDTATAPLAIAASQTLGALAQAATDTVSDAGVVAQALGALVQSTGATVTDSVAVAQTLGALVQVATATAPVPGALQATQTLGALGQALTGTVLDAATVAQNLGALGQSVAAAGTDAAAVAQTLGAIVQATSGAVIDAAAVSQALGALNQTATAIATSSGFQAAQTLGGIVQALTGTVIDAATVAQALGGLGQAAAGGVVATIPARTDALPALGQTATGVHVSFANVAQVLGALSQIATAQGPGEADFLVSQILGGLQQIAASNVPQRVQAAQALGALGQTVALRITPVAGVTIHGSAVKLRRGFGSLGQLAVLAGSLRSRTTLSGQSRARIILSGSTR